MEKKIFIVACLIGASLCGSAQTLFDKKLKSLYRNTVPLINERELNQLFLSKEKFILLDTRALDEYNISHISNAYFVDYNHFSIHGIDTINRNTSIIIYCSVGYRSERIGEKLLKLGFKDVKNLYGGIFEWVNNGNKVIDSFGRVTEKVHTYNKSWSQWLAKGEKIY